VSIGFSVSTKSEVGGKSSVYREIRGLSPSKVVHKFGYWQHALAICKNPPVSIFTSALSSEVCTTTVVVLSADC
jgi:hypothetical protein